MRILVLHSAYASGAVSGENRVVIDEQRLLRDAGHDVAAWTPAVEGTTGARVAGRAVWSRAAQRELGSLVRDHRPDVVHIHNLFPMLSPAVLRSADVPVVMTLHNYRLLCLPATLTRDDAPCTDCVGRGLWRGVARGCYRGSRAASGALAASVAVHRRLGSFEHVSTFLAVSDFVRGRYVDGGFDSTRIRVRPNFAWPTVRRRAGAGDYFLYVGRLSPEKGIDALVRSWDPSLGRLVVAGDGPVDVSGRPGVEALGRLAPNDIAPLLQRARAVVVPSRWYEGSPRTIVEAYAAGVPVVASDIGGIGELVAHDESGLLVPLDDASAWRDAFARLLDDAEAERLGTGALQRWRQRYSPERALASLVDAYEQAAA